MFQPKTLECYAAQVILDREISINIGIIPQNLQENIRILKRTWEKLESVCDGET